MRSKAAVWIVVVALLLARQSAAQLCAYVGSGGFNKVSILNLDGNELAASVMVEGEPSAVAISPDGQTGYTANQVGHSVSVFSTVTRQVEKTIPLGCDAVAQHGCNPADIVVDAKGLLVYVVNLRSSSLSVIDAVQREVAMTISVGADGPAAIAITADQQTAFTANLFADSVSVIDLVARRALRSIRVGMRPFDLAITPDGKHLYVANTESGTITVLRISDMGEVVTIPVGGFPNGIAIDPNGAFAYVAGAPEGAVSVIDTTTNEVQSSIMIGGELADVVLTADGSRAYVTEFTLGNVFILDTFKHALRGFITIGGGSGPQRLALASVAGGCPLPPTITPTATATLVYTPTPTPTGLAPPALATALAGDDSEVVVDRGAAFPEQGTIKIDAEILTFSGKSDNRLTGVVRGLAGSLAVAHAAGARVILVGGRGDANCDAVLSAADTSALVVQLRQGEAHPCGGDFDGDGTVTVDDIGPLLTAVFDAS